MLRFQRADFRLRFFLGLPPFPSSASSSPSSPEKPREQVSDQSTRNKYKTLQNKSTKTYALWYRKRGQTKTFQPTLYCQKVQAAVSASAHCERSPLPSSSSSPPPAASAAFASAFAAAGFSVAAFAAVFSASAFSISVFLPALAAVALSARACPASTCLQQCRRCAYVACGDYSRRLQFKRAL